MATSSNLQFANFPTDYHDLPTVSFVIPDLLDDMHTLDSSCENGDQIRCGDTWLKKNLDGYYQWAKQNNSLLILTFDEDANEDHLPHGLTNPAAQQLPARNQIVTILAGAHIRPGNYAEKSGVTHVNILRTLEAMYGLNRSGAQQTEALAAGIADGFIITDVFAP